MALRTGHVLDARKPAADVLPPMVAPALRRRFVTPSAYGSNAPGAPDYERAAGSAESGYVVGPNTPRPSPFAPWQTAHEPVYAIRPVSRARRSFATGFVAFPPSTWDTTDTAASP